MSKHYSVLLNESIDNLNIKEDGIYVDCTLGYAGHSSQILKRITRGCLFAFDQDNEAISSSTKRLGDIGNNFEIIKSNFVHLEKEIKNPPKNHLRWIFIIFFCIWQYTRSQPQ